MLVALIASSAPSILPLPIAPAYLLLTPLM